MCWLLLGVILLVALAAGFFVGVAYGQEHRNE